MNGKITKDGELYLQNLTEVWEPCLCMNGQVCSTKCEYWGGVGKTDDCYWHHCEDQEIGGTMCLVDLIDERESV